MKSCDPLPAFLLKGCLDLLLPVIYRTVNTSLEQGVVTEYMKEALLRPLLKKLSLDHEVFSNFRQIFNVPFLSKTCERMVHSKVQDHVSINNLEEPFQSAYKTGHSTESALLGFRTIFCWLSMATDV